MQEKEQTGSGREQTPYKAQGRHPARPGKVRSTWVVVVLMALLIMSFYLIAPNWPF